MNFFLDRVGVNGILDMAFHTWEPADGNSTGHGKQDDVDNTGGDEWSWEPLKKGHGITF